MHKAGPTDSVRCESVRANTEGRWFVSKGHSKGRQCTSLGTLDVVCVYGAYTECKW